MFQSFNLLPDAERSGEHHACLPRLAGRKVDQDWLGYLVDQLGVGDRLTHRPNQLSGGQQQRVACARALINRPDIIFADEPTGNLDSNASADLLAFLRRSVTEIGQSIVMVTHDPRGAAYADRVVFLADGTVVGELEQPTADSVLERVRTLGADVRTVTIKGLLAHKLRLALTALAIVLGVTFISGTYVLTDTLHNTFTGLFGNIYDKIDFQVRGVAQFGRQRERGRDDPPAVAAHHGPRACPASRPLRARSSGYAQFVAPRRQGGQNRRRADPRRDSTGIADLRLHLIAGGPPVTAGRRADGRRDGAGLPLHRGRAGPHPARRSPRTFTITGIAQFGTANNLAGATLAAFTLPTAQQAIGGASSMPSTWSPSRAPARPRCSRTSPGAAAGWRWSPGRPW